MFFGITSKTDYFFIYLLKINQKMKVVIKGLEVEYNNKIYYCDGYADMSESDIIGTEHEGQYEIINESAVSHIEVDRIDIIIDGKPIGVTNDSEIIEIMKEEIERYIENL